jgi:hypothetical protein
MNEAVPGQPSFLVVGAPRAGTTSLHYYLDQHPEIAMSAVKEPGHFLFVQTDRGPQPLIDDPRIIKKSVSDPTAYAALFDVRPHHRAVGEASPLYLYTRETAAIVADELPGVRVIAVLREPIARAWSHFLYLDRANGNSRVDAFRDVALHEASKGADYEPYRAGSHFLRLGLYASQLAPYFNLLGRDRVHVIWFDDLQDRPAEVLARLCHFLGVDDEFSFDTSIRYNSAAVSGRTLSAVRSALGAVQPQLKAWLPRSVVKSLARTRARMQSRFGDVPPRMEDEAPEVVAYLQEWFKPSNDALGLLLESTALGWDS